MDSTRSFPKDAAARAGLRSGEVQQQKHPLPLVTGSTWARRTWPLLLDALLLSGIAMIVVAGCVILAIMLWQSPGTIRAAYMPTATSAVPPATFSPTLTPIRLATSTTAPLPSATHTPLPTATMTRVASGQLSLHTSLGIKRIEIELSEQKLTAFEGDTPVLEALVSTGVAQFPTPIGEYLILRKVRTQTMSGPGYYLPNVEFVSYFYKGYAMHGTYWHDNFGHPMSHGCVNMRNDDAQWIYEWAPIGTPVSVRR